MQKIILSAVGSLLGLMSFAVIIQFGSQIEDKNPESLEQLIELTNTYSLTEAREKESRFIIHNLALMIKLKAKGTLPEIAVLGSSRAKPIALEYFGKLNSVNLASNSYNEMPYGLLVQAELAKKYLPTLETFLVEASFLLRRPKGISTEKDHQKYAFALRQLADEFPSWVHKAEIAGSPNLASWRELISTRDHFRLSTFDGHKFAGYPYCQSTRNLTALAFRGKRLFESGLAIR